MRHGRVHECDEKLRAHFLHMGTPSATGLLSNAYCHFCSTGNIFLIVNCWLLLFFLSFPCANFFTNFSTLILIIVLIHLVSHMRSLFCHVTARCLKVSHLADFTLSCFVSLSTTDCSYSWQPWETGSCTLIISRIACLFLINPKRRRIAPMMMKFT